MKKTAILGLGLIIIFFPSCSEQKKQEDAVMPGVDEASAKRISVAKALELGTDITQEELEAKKQDNLVIDFYASWCGPCKRLKPVIDALAPEYGDSVYFVKVDIDKYKGIASGVKSIPTLHFYQNGKQIHQAVGGHSKEGLKQLINEKFKL